MSFLIEFVKGGSKSTLVNVLSGGASKCISLLLRAGYNDGTDPPCLLICRDASSMRNSSQISFGATNLEVKNLF